MDELENLTYNDLAKTGIVLLLKKIKKKSNELLRENITQLLTKWQEKYGRHKNSKKSNKNEIKSPEKAKNSESKKDIKSSEKEKVPDSQSKQKELSPNKEEIKKKRPKLFDEHKLPQPRDTTRNNIYNAFMENVNNYDEEKVSKKADEIERCLYVSLKGNKYGIRARSIISNLMDKENIEFRQKVLNDQISPETLTTMDVLEMTSKEIKDKTEKIERDGLEKIRSDYDKEHTKIEEGLYTCFKCKSKKTRQYEQQTRSADEPMTIFVTCVDCGNSWRMG